MYVVNLEVIVPSNHHARSIVTYYRIFERVSKYTHVGRKYTSKVIVVVVTRNMTTVDDELYHKNNYW